LTGTVSWDIVEVEQTLTATVAGDRDHLLNDLPEFAGLNPSLEAFCRILCVSLGKSLPVKHDLSFTFVLWENNTAWASYPID
jgi:6-pyruvoyltetrahydropterin/6-carboxytetrahydropterin synthase